MIGSLLNLEFCNIGHSYGNVEALADLSLAVSSGEIACLLGPSGCGKTTLLHLAAGLQDVQQGEIRLGQEVLANARQNPPPEKRPVGLVFQEGALFPHMSIAKNIAFGLDAAADTSVVVSQWLEKIGLSGFGERFPHMLSGGQQQRVALARAIAPEPAILLMDEPFANIDFVLRRELREDTRKLLQARGATAILVTHDPQEAMEIGDRIAVMDRGRVVQYDTPDALLDTPATAAIGSMVGRGQIVAGTRAGDVIETAFGRWPASCLKNQAASEQLDLLVHPAALVIDPDGQGCSVLDIRRAENSRIVVLQAQSGEHIKAEVSLEASCSPGDHVGLKCNSGQIATFPRAS